MAKDYASMLTVGGIQIIQRDDDGSRPVLQVLEVKTVAGNRLRVYLWDGSDNFNYGMVSSQMVQQLQKQLTPFTIIQVNTFNISRKENNKSVTILMDIDVVADGDDVKEKIILSEGQRKALSEVTAANNISSTTASNKNSFNNQGMRTPQKSAMGRPASMMGGTPRTPSGSAVMPIASLNPYQSRVTIRGRVSSKGEIRKWSKATGSGQLFSFDVIDDSGEIRVTAFNEQVDKYYELVQIKQVYFISGFQCKPANKNFRTNNNEYELSLGKFSNLELCTEAADDLPMQTFAFQKIADVEGSEANSLVDLCAVVKSICEPQTFNRKSDGQPLTKRELTLVDDSRKAITMTLWNASATQFEAEGNPIIVVSKARVNEFNGQVSVSLGQASSMEVDPDGSDNERVDELRRWWQSGGSALDFEGVRGSGTGSTGDFGQEWMDFEVMQRRGDAIDVSDKPMYVWNRVTITMFNKDNAMYRACASEGCQKKVVEQGEQGMYLCEKCGGQPTPNFKWRLMLKMVVSDASRQFWATAFNDKAEQILQVTAATLGEYAENDPDKLDQTFSEAMFKEFHMKFRGKKEVYQDESRFQLSVVDAKEVKVTDDCKHLLKEIEAMEKLL